MWEHSELWPMWLLLTWAGAVGMLTRCTARPGADAPGALSCRGRCRDGDCPNVRPVPCCHCTGHSAAATLRSCRCKARRLLGCGGSCPARPSRPPQSVGPCCEAGGTTWPAQTQRAFRACARADSPRLCRYPSQKRTHGSIQAQNPPVLCIKGVAGVGRLAPPSRLVIRRRQLAPYLVSRLSRQAEAQFLWSWKVAHNSHRCSGSVCGFVAHASSRCEDCTKVVCGRGPER